MDRIWLKLIGVMICTSIGKYAVMHPAFWVVLDLTALGVCYLLLRSVPTIDIKTSMWYLAGFTAISILVDMGVINGLFGQILSLAVIGWLLWRNRTPRIKRQQLRHKWHK